MVKPFEPQIYRDEYQLVCVKLLKRRLREKKSLLKLRKTVSRLLTSWRRWSKVLKIPRRKRQKERRENERIWFEYWTHADKESKPFDSPDWIYELKLDGTCAVVYTDGKELQIRNKRMLRLDPIFPELQYIPKQVHRPYILDGEVFVAVNGKPDFAKVQARALMSNHMKIECCGQVFCSSCG